MLRKIGHRYVNEAAISYITVTRAPAPGVVGNIKVSYANGEVDIISDEQGCADVMALLAEHGHGDEPAAPEKPTRK